MDAKIMLIFKMLLVLVVLILNVVELLGVVGIKILKLLISIIILSKLELDLLKILTLLQGKFLGSWTPEMLIVSLYILNVIIKDQVSKYVIIYHQHLTLHIKVFICLKDYKPLFTQLKIIKEKLELLANLIHA